MSGTAEKLKSELALLPLNERAEIAHFLLESLDSEVDDDVEAEWAQEVERRIDEFDEGITDARPVDEVLAELRNKHS